MDPRAVAVEQLPRGVPGVRVRQVPVELGLRHRDDDCRDPGLLLGRGLRLRVHPRALQGSDLRRPAGDDDAAGPGDDHPAVQVLRPDRLGEHLLPPHRAALARGQRLRDLPAAPVLPHHSAGLHRGGAHGRRLRAAHPLARRRPLEHSGHADGDGVHFPRQLERSLRPPSSTSTTSGSTRCRSGSSTSSPRRG